MKFKRIKHFRLLGNYLIITFKKTLWAKKLLLILDQKYKQNDGYLGVAINMNNEVEITFILRNREDIEPYLNGIK